MYPLQERSGALSARRPTRVELLISLHSHCANVTYRGCRYLRQGRAETLWKYQALHHHFEERQVKSIFHKRIRQDEREYILLGFTEEVCMPSQ